jgi:hypothetical protein
MKYDWVRGGSVISGKADLATAEEALKMRRVYARRIFDSLERNYSVISILRDFSDSVLGIATFKTPSL